MNIYQMYEANDYQFGFYVRKTTWPPGQKAEVLAIECVTERQPIEGPPPYFTEGLVYPSGHKKEGQKMGPRKVILGAPWAKGGKRQVNGGTFNWEQVEPSEFMISQNIYEMYMANDCKFGFWVTRPKWSPGVKAQVVAIEGVTEGEPIPGKPPHFNKEVAGLKSGAPGTTRTVTLKSDWYDGGYQTYGNGGTYSWERVD